MLSLLSWSSILSFGTIALAMSSASSGFWPAFADAYDASLRMKSCWRVMRSRSARGLASVQRPFFEVLQVTGPHVGERGVAVERLAPGRPR